MLNVLVVDDSVVMRKMVARSLNIGGVPVRELYEAGDGSEALTVMDSRWIDLVLCDINMPGMDGIELVRRMVANEVTRRVPVVMVSTERSEPRIQELKSLGIVGYLHKPFKPEELAQLVREVLGLAGEVMIEATTTLLHDVTREVLEDTAFLMTEVAPSEVAWPDRLTRASVEFHGPLSGKLSLVAGEELLISVAADMLGVTPDDEDALSHADAALAELANIVAGSLMAKLFGTSTVCRLGVPQLSPETAELVAAAAREGVVRIDMEARPLLVELEVKGAVPS